MATHQGNPVPGLVIFFQEGEGPRFWCISDAEGKFTLTGEHGVELIPRGNYDVWIAYDPQPADPVSMIMGGPPKDPPGLKQMLAKYGKRDKSPLKVSVNGAMDDVALAFD
ncbi:MAG: hypothetical protein SFU86_23660 [Pirellulaceae bacterium]|nr:hypothetical protein [Pirellulaceae bacterium]